MTIIQPPRSSQSPTGEGIEQVDLKPLEAVHSISVERESSSCCYREKNTLMLDLQDFFCKTNFVLISFAV